MNDRLKNYLITGMPSSDEELKSAGPIALIIVGIIVVLVIIANIFG